MSTRPNWRGVFFRAVVRRAGPRSGGILATGKRHQTRRYKI